MIVLQCGNDIITDVIYNNKIWIRKDDTRGSYLKNAAFYKIIGLDRFKTVGGKQFNRFRRIAYQFDF